MRFGAESDAVVAELVADGEMQLANILHKAEDD